MVAPLPDFSRILQRIHIFCFKILINDFDFSDAFAVPKSQTPYFIGFLLFYHTVYAEETGI
jgi:hypothetical protein